MTATAPPETLRVDKWLWQARFFKSRSLASKLCVSNRLRINEVSISKAHATVSPGDVLTFPKGPHIRVIKIIALSTRRGPAPEAKALYEDLEPPQPIKKAATNAGVKAIQRDAGTGRPTKAERRATDLLRGRD